MGHMLSQPSSSLRVRSFGVMWIRISDSRSLGSWCIKGTDESTDSSVPLMNHDLSDLGSLILIHITPKERTLNVCEDIMLLEICFITFDQKRFAKAKTWKKLLKDVILDVSES